MTGRTAGCAAGPTPGATPGATVGRTARGGPAPAPSPQGAPAPLRAVAERLAVEHPEARTELVHTSAFELLVATALSAQTTDVRVNAATAVLFERWPDAAALAAADPAAVEDVIRPVGMAPTKSRRIIALAAALLEHHGGEVPSEQSALEALPGVGRKTALVVRGVWFGQDALAVDTHVGRLARRLGWSAATDPARIEADVVDLAETETPARPPVDLTALSLRLILHGRATCTARRPACGRCALADLCPSAGEAA
ncbi:endonuclease III domain-containing protein [Brachybacterium nesterenkovii]|uniref:endonuclease III domain-containing protein n=1 Tax=Brachybacterium nesterenkovii TaxID=47847 RepID=UPI00321B6887